ncbi:hypothetical protein L195_g059030 [Trifolium pratense]|uniref:Uncharacterized protein n=1 Tax=Trifolium pratense TaxID=57577 RepID=A0A2K3JVN7_TRIPR|nr:hypothetical protein L195_g059030 [Trifolium pratense]
MMSQPPSQQRRASRYRNRNKVNDGGSRAFQLNLGCGMLFDSFSKAWGC